MKSRPILFSAPMVRAILEGRKTQTRRIVKNAHIITCDDRTGVTDNPCPYGVPGDELWVKETHAIVPWYDGEGSLDNRVLYRADDPPASQFDPDRGDKWRPSIHMPRSASRLTLRVLSVRVERLQDISEEDAKAEGVAWTSGGSLAVPLFEALWKKINGPDSWPANPWVWVVEFEKMGGAA